MSKELKHCRHVEDLEVNENVKAKAKDYVKKYMSKFGTMYRKTSSPDDKKYAPAIDNYGQSCFVK
jgi:histone-lysine N-methyltransferase SETD2